MPATDLPPLPSSARPSLRWIGLAGAATALYVARAADQARGPLLVVTRDAATAARLEEELGFFVAEGTAILPFPGYETLPYDQFSPHPDIISQRLRAMARLPTLERGIVIVDLPTALQRLPPRTFVDGHALSLKTGEALDLEKFRLRLTSAGYASVPQVAEPGDFAIRGSLFDVFPMGSDAPLRIDLFDDVIDSIRSFDAETQRSLDKLTRLDLLPAREFSLSPESIKDFRRRFRTRFQGDLTRMPLYRDVGEGLAPAGIEYYLPLFFESTASLIDYLPPGTTVLLPSDHEAGLTEAWRTLVERHEERRFDIEHPVLDPAEVCVPADEWLASATALPHVFVGEPAPEAPQIQLQPPPPVPVHDFGTAPAPSARLDQRREETLHAFAEQVRGTAGRVLLAAESAGRRELLLDLLRPYDVRARVVTSWAEFLAADAPIVVAVAPIASGVTLREPAVTIYAEEQLFGERARQERRRRRSDRDPAKIIQQLADLRPGAPVVHEDYGVGRYTGLATMDAAGTTAEFLVLEYAGGDKLYVPVQALERISRYTGAPAESAPLHKLGGDQWSKARARAAARIRDAAAELLDVYARRAARQGHAFPVDDQQLRAFEAGFPFEETVDQLNAIQAVVDDLRSGKPMDRVVCGDVGFGKTEVALRAAFVAVQGGKQVAVLVPTTLLAQQHYETFVDRFADWPVKIELLSRFRAGARAQAALDGLASGKVDIVVGTHRLLQPGVKFKDLGLVIIDEEHRFGVRDKEKLKALRAEVDVLTLTATPIPRTLNMTLGGLRDLSLITTPPAARLSIKTFVSEWNDPTIREACLRELRRGGQVYVVHNRIETIDRKAQQLAELVPEARIAIGHGQMRERDLEQVMLDFYHKRANLLLCTTIIESGIDVPTANTIIVDRADRFGLAQLHQLRGRVGRSHHQAYAYLIAPPRNAMTADAQRRLEAIESLEDLGAGFVLATHDLEIRGAGELLGEDQSGQIQEIGFALYTELLERAVKAMQAGKELDLGKPLHHGPEIELHVPALLPESYLPDVHARLVLYKRISSVQSVTELDDLQAETMDRFGPLPEPAKNSFRIARLRVVAAPLSIERMDVGSTSGSVAFGDDTPLDPGALILFLQKSPRTMRFDGPKKIRFTGKWEDPEERFAAAQQLLDDLSRCVTRH
ncbi:MAG TPA: transcription-repair coupling factor [Steroidobacteraceae bacterium]|nr:transcription-repair coupling factor [Steroidobacteraceae bacterium]